MVKYWIYYEDESYELIKCPECRIDDIKHVHEPGQYEELICNQCATRFGIEKRKEKIVKILSEEEVDDLSKIVSDESAKGLRESEERAKRLREENKE
jgi:uncharacterized protein YbaR (Trm112 family)